LISDHNLNKVKPSDVVLLGVPFDHNSSYQRGPASAPAFIRERFYSNSGNLCAENGTDLSLKKNWHDFGDLKSTDLKNSFKIIEKSVLQIIEKQGRILSLGGDHAITYPLIKAYSKTYSNLTILHFDAHPDLYDNLNGNPLSHASPFARIMEQGLVNKLIQVGVRTINPHQREQIEKFNVYTIEMKDFTSNINLNLTGPIYISFDMDALDPAFAPGVSHHEPGGFTTRQVLRIIQSIGVAENANAKIVGADIVELNPLNDINLITASASAKLLKEILSKMVT